MSLMFTCDDKATLVAYLYDEIDAADRQQVDEHLRRCAACATEVGALADVRTELTQWTPPNADLGFTIVRNERPAGLARSRRPRSCVPPSGIAPCRPGHRRWRPYSCWRSVRRLPTCRSSLGPEGFVVSTGWMTPAAAPATVAPAATVSTNDEQWKTALIALEQQLRDEIRATKETGTVRAASRSQRAPTTRRYGA